MTTVGDGTPSARVRAGRFFAEPMRDYVLPAWTAGQRAPGGLPGAAARARHRRTGRGRLRDLGTAVDGDEPLARQVLLRRASAYDDVITGDLRTVSIPQRAFDVVYCAAAARAGPSRRARARPADQRAQAGRAAASSGPPTATARRRCSTGCCPARPGGPSGPGSAPASPARSPRSTRRRVSEGHRLLRPDARPGHRRPRQRADPSRPAARAIIVGANHLRGHRPAEQRPLRRQSRRAALRDPQAA